MSEASLRAAIQARLLALGAGMGRVHDYERWANTPGEFLRLFQDPVTKKVFGWEIVRSGFKMRKIAMAKWEFSHQFIVRGYYVLNDAAETEKTINTLVDAIAVDFALTPLAGTEKGVLPEGDIETRMFGAALCHVAEIRLPSVSEVVKAAESEIELTAIGLRYYLQDPEDDGVADAEDEVALNVV